MPAPLTCFVRLEWLTIASVYDGPATASLPLHEQALALMPAQDVTATCCGRLEWYQEASIDEPPFNRMKYLDPEDSYDPLMVCPTCGQRWICCTFDRDTWTDPYTYTVCCKVSGQADITDRDRYRLRGEAHDLLIIAKAGGLSDGTCHKPGCTAKALRGGSPYCVRHVREMARPRPLPADGR